MEAPLLRFYHFSVIYAPGLSRSNYLEKLVIFPLLISEDADIELHKRLSDAIREAILSKRIGWGSAFPSSRALSNSLGISRGTVIRCYENLKRLGYLVTKPGAKTFVAEHPPSLPNSPQINLSPCDQFEALRLNANGVRLQAESYVTASALEMPELHYGAPPAWALPTTAWKQFLSKCCQNLDHNAVDFSPPAFGSIALRLAIADFLNRTKAVDCSFEQIIVFPNSTSSYVHISQILVEPGDCIACEEPGYLDARNILQMSHGTIIPISVDENGLDVESLKQIDGLKMVIVSPVSHDPTGFVLSGQRRKELIKLADERKLLIIEDAFDSEYNYIKPNPVALFAERSSNNIFFLHSFWRTMYPLSALECMVIPPQYIDIFEKLKKLIDPGIPVLEHNALADFISSGAYERHLKTVKTQLARNRMLLIDALKRAFRQQIYIGKQNGSYWLTVMFIPDLSESTITKSAKKAGLRVLSARCCYGDRAKEGAPFFISFSDISAETINWQVEQFEELASSCRI